MLFCRQKMADSTMGIFPEMVASGSHRYRPNTPASMATSLRQARTTVRIDRCQGRSRVADDTGSVHTPIMTLKNAALLALIGTILATALLGWTFVVTVVNVLRGLAPAVMLFSWFIWFIYAFACFSVAVFF